jgi:catechol 2,3-dioxygenase-like lactoylglutathione lyase family enzyme
MPCLKIFSTNHTGFTVSNLDRSISFFRDVLGFAVISKAPRDPEAISRITGVAGARVMIAYLQGPGHKIELIEYLAPEERGHVRPRPCDAGHAHLAFEVDDIEAAIAEAEDHNVRPIGMIMTVDKGPNAGARAAYLQDQDGITIEFIQPPRQQ